MKTKREYQIERVMELMDTDEETARAYLEAEEWVSWDAMQSIKADREGGLLPK